MTDTQNQEQTDVVQVVNPAAGSSVVLVCEHASHYIPDCFHNLGLSGDALTSHAAWDPGAMPVARRLAERLDAALVASCISRLVYDCNRPPEAPDAMPPKSEIFDIPGNLNLSQSQRDARTEAYYLPFRDAVAKTAAQVAEPVIVTIHSFTPVYHGKTRAVEIGVLHDSDTRLADAMLQNAADHTKAVVERNAPYGPEHGVTHTLKEHGIAGGHMNVMLEIRNDLIDTPERQTAMADMIAEWISDAYKLTQAKGAVTCVA